MCEVAVPSTGRPFSWRGGVSIWAACVATLSLVGDTMVSSVQLNILLVIRFAVATGRDCHCYCRLW